MATSKRRSLGQAFVDQKANVSDKWEHYPAVYQRELAAMIAKGKPMTVLEIGIQNGGSLQIWREFLPKGSQIVGVEINPQAADLELGERIVVHIADATDKIALDTVLGEQIFDVIVDDGSHLSAHMIASFELCFDRLAPGGVYFIEDVHCSYLTDFGGGLRKDGSAIEYFKDLADAINVDHFEADAVTNLPSEELGRLKKLGHSVANVSFYDSVIVIRKLHGSRKETFSRVLTGAVSPLAEIDDYVDILPLDQLRSLLLSSSAFSRLSPRMLEALTEAREDVGRLKERLHATDSKLDVAQRQVDELRQENDRAIERVLAARDDEVKRLRSQISSLEEQLMSATAARADGIEQLRSQISSLEEQLMSATAARADEIERLRSQISFGENQLRCITAERDDIRRHLELSTVEAHRMHEQLRAMQTSTLWKASWPVRALLNRSPAFVKTFGRRFAKVVWWTASGQILGRLRDWRNSRRPVASDDPGAAPGETASPVYAAKLVDADAHAEPAEGASSVEIAESVVAADPYAVWRSTVEPDVGALNLQRRLARGLNPRPKLSVLVPVFRTPIDVLGDMIASVQKQTYDNWELCLAIVDEGERSRDLVKLASGVASSDARIKIRLLAENLGISENSNQGLEMVEGQWTVLLDHDDLLTADALYEVARAINANPSAVFIYSDKDNVDRTGTHRFGPLLKPAWSPDILLNANYLTHLCAMKTRTLRAIGGWDATTDGAQDWDLFLRIISAGGEVVHVPRVLYHWRWIETSVAAGGFDAKPYAAKGQLNALHKYLPVAGWEGAKADFEGPYIRIAWRTPISRSVSIIRVGSGGDNIAATNPADEILVADGPNLAAAVDAAIARARGDILVLVDAGYIPLDASSIDELVLPLSNPVIAAVGGRVLDAEERVVDYGTFFQNGVAYPAFRGEHRHYYGPAGSAGWYRNAAAAPGGALAFRRSTWTQLGGFSAFASSGRPDLAFLLEARCRGYGRVLLNPFALFAATQGACAFERSASGPIAAEHVWEALPEGDPFVNPHLDASSGGAPAIRAPKTQSARSPSHDFVAEAQNVAVWFDATRQEIETSVASCAAASGAPLQRVVWIIPEFSVPFYGGINTILRNAEHMRTRHGVAPVFAVLGGDSPARVRSKIGRAFPQLAASCEIVILTSADVLDLGPTDAAVCTLWTTAFVLLRLRNVRRKFYFLQDWEPLFYPSGTLSTIVESTYRFGYHAVANTPSLAESYRQLGGLADHFMPAVDPAIFHARDRVPRGPNDPFVLVSYTRPGTPRNCFEALAEGMKMLKAKFGERIEILTAGAEWDPAQYGLGGIVRNLGLLSYAETGILYRTADAGLVAMATRHPSYLPFEWMACGAAVVTNRNPYTEWLLRDGKNCLLCEMTRSDIFEAVSRLIEEPQLRDALATQAVEDIQRDHSDWVATCERVYEIMNSVALRSDPNLALTSVRQERPAGKLAMSGGPVFGDKIFLLRNGKRHWIRSGAWIRDNGFAFPEDVETVADEALLRHQPGQPAPGSFTADQQRWAVPTNVGEARDIAASQLHGRGLEIGAGASPFPVPLACDVTYGDAYSYKELRSHAYIGQSEHDIVIPTIKTDLDTLQDVEDESLDFIVACHVIEHTRNPIGAIATAYKRLRPGGHLVLVIPDKERTFDKNRDVTALDHLILDFERPDRQRDREHYRDFFEKADGFDNWLKSNSTSWEEQFEKEYSIHFHTWTYDSFGKMVDWLIGNVCPFELEWKHMAVDDGIEFYYTLRKPKG